MVNSWFQTLFSQNNLFSKVLVLIPKPGPASGSGSRTESGIKPSSGSNSGLVFTSQNWWFYLAKLGNCPTWFGSSYGLTCSWCFRGLLSYFVEHLKQCVDNTCKRNFVHLFLCFIIDFGSDLCIISWTSHY